MPKRADDQPLTRVSVDWTQRGQLGTHLDIGRRFGENNAFGVRFNGVYRNGDTAVDHQSREFPMLSLGLDFRGERLRLSSDLLYQKESLEGVVRPLLTGREPPTSPTPRTRRHASACAIPTWTRRITPWSTAASTTSPTT